MFWSSKQILAPARLGLFPHLGVCVSASNDDRGVDVNADIQLLFCILQSSASLSSPYLLENVRYGDQT